MRCSAAPATLPPEDGRVMSRAFLIAVALAFAVASHANAGEKTKQFPTQKFKVSLPDKGWNWADEDGTRGSVTATSGDGLMLSVTTVHSPKAFSVGASFAKGFDEGFFKDGAYVKRGGKFIKYRGAPCYQALFQAAEDKRTGVIRVIGLNDFCYQIQLLGAANPPVEKRRDFEAIMKSVEFMK